MPTLRDVAAAAAVSRTTASLVLGGRAESGRIAPETAERVRAAAARLGYRGNYHARSLTTGRSWSIGLVGQDDDLDKLVLPYASGLTAGVMHEARRHGCHCCAICAGAQDPAPVQRAVDEFHQGRHDALIILGPALTADSEALLRRAGDRCMVLVQYDGELPLPRLCFDRLHGFEQACVRLAAAGHRRICCLELDLPCTYPPRPVAERLAAQRALAADLGLELDALVLPHEACFGGGEAAARMADLAQRQLSDVLVSRPPWTALLAFNDAVASGALRALRAAGLRVPEDCSLIGYDDSEAALLDPPLSSIDHRFTAMGRLAVAMAMYNHRSRSSGCPPLRERIVRGRLRWRASCAAAPVD